MRKLVTAVGYLRMSTEDQDKSIEDQEKEIRTWAERNGFRIIRFYSDEAISGTKHARGGFQQLIKDVQTIRDFDSVLCWSQDRFSRFDILDAAAYWKILRDADVTIFTVCEGEVSFDKIDKLLLACINQHGSHDYCKKLSRNSARGMKSTAEAGFWASGAAPYGYIRAAHPQNPKRKCLVVDQVKAENVRRIFEMFAKGKCMRQIAIWLNEHRISSSRGGTWLSHTVSQILKNPVYCGDIVWGKQAVGDHGRIIDGEYMEVGRKSPKRVVKQEADCVVYRNSHEAIVSRTLFAQAQEKLAMNKHFGRRPRAKSSAISGLCYCGHCGSKMGVRQIRKPLSEKPQYALIKCNGHVFATDGKDREPCACCYNLQAVLDLVVNKIRSAHLTEERLAGYRQTFLDILKSQRGGKDSKVKSLKSSLAEVEKKLAAAEEKAIDVPADMADLFYKKIRSLRERRLQISSELQAQDQIGDISERAVADDVNAKIAILKRTRELISDCDPAVARAAIESIVTKIELFSEPISGKAARGFCARKRSLKKIVLHCKAPISAEFTIDQNTQTGRDLVYRADRTRV